MKLNKSEQDLLDVIDGIKPGSITKIKGSRIIYTKRHSKAIDSLKLKGLIYKNPHTLMLIRI